MQYFCTLYADKKLRTFCLSIYSVYADKQLSVYTVYADKQLSAYTLYADKANLKSKHSYCVNRSLNHSFIISGGLSGNYSIFRSCADNQDCQHLLDIHNRLRREKTKYVVEGGPLQRYSCSQTFSFFQGIMITPSSKQQRSHHVSHIFLRLNFQCS